MKSPVDLLLALFDDLKRNEPDIRCLERDLITLKRRFEHEGLGFLTKTLPLLCDALDRGLADEVFVCPTNFCKLGALPRFLGGLLQTVFEVDTGRLKDNPNTRIVKSLREILRIFKKATLSTSDEALLHQRAVRSFFDMDDAIPDTLPDRESHSLRTIAKVLLPSLGSFDPRELKPKHGPGTVAERLTPHQKWYGVLNAINDGDLDDYGFDIYRSGHSDLYGPNRVVRPSDRRYALRGCAKVLSVPKTTSSRRTITSEPLIRQYVQQGLNQVLRDNILQCKVLRNCLDLTQQEHNRILALEGSISGVWATIDLSSASDLLGSHLVSLVFDRHALFFKHMMSCRSPEASDGKTSKVLRKFAGMGNALTFPVQSVVFAVIAIAAILDSEGRRLSYGNIKRASKLVRVFGDDIIVPVSRASQVVSWLEALGLRVNRHKSFWTGKFRESCGLDAFMGVDITPTYLRTSLDLSSTDPGDIASHVSTSNQLWMKGLYHASEVIKDAVEGALGRDLPLVRLNSPSLGWHTRHNATTIQSWRKDLQSFSFRGPAQVPCKRRDPLRGNAGLLAWFTIANSRERVLQQSYGFLGSRSQEPCGFSPGREDGFIQQLERLENRSLDCLDPIPGRDWETSAIRFKSRIVWKRMPSF